MQRAEIERLLPGVFQRTVRDGEPLAALLDVMEALHAPAEDVLAHTEKIFDPRLAPDSLVPFLAGWVDLGWLLDRPKNARLEPLPSDRLISSGVGRLRELITGAAELYQWRGTARGLRLFLQKATGIADIEIEERVIAEGGQPCPFRIRVAAPESAKPHRKLIERIIESEKPAYVTCDLVFR